MEEKQLTLRELRDLIITWARIKGLNDSGKQHLKMCEEIGETAKEILTGDKEKAQMEIGDIAVTVLILYWQEQQKLRIDLKPVGEELTIDNAPQAYKDLVQAIGNRDMHVLYFLDVVCRCMDSRLVECLQMAWDKIKGRKGKTINGTFVKEQDLPAEVEVPQPEVEVKPQPKKRSAAKPKRRKK